MSIEDRNNSIRESYRIKHEKWVSDITSKCSKEELEEYYLTHNKKEVCKFFNLPNSSISFLIKLYGIKKDKESISRLRENTCLEKYGVSNPSKSKEIRDKTRKTNLEKYGVEYNLCTDSFKEKSKQTCLEKYGTEFANQSDEVKDKIMKSKIDKHGSIEDAYKLAVLKSRETRILNSGSLDKSYKDGIKNQSKVILERYGVPYACMREEARNFSNNSFPNREFASILDKNNISYVREFTIDKYSYDFKVGSVLIEINPFSTHNSTWGIFSVSNKKDMFYHYDKTKTAIENGFRCIHVWDWDNIDIIINMLKADKVKVYARKCGIKEVSLKKADLFLNENHLQGTCKNQAIRLGLYYNNELIEIMTFGKPRYNKNYKYELLRLCTKLNYIVIGGTKKLFNFFIKNYEYNSIISYCDNSKFLGNVYKELGFSLYSYGEPSKHWYNGKTKKHFTDNLLRQLGADKLIGTNYGKGTNNEDILKENNFVEIYDCGQSTYILKGEF